MLARIETTPDKIVDNFNLCISLANWLLAHTVSTIKKKWPNLASQNDESIKQSLAQQVEDYNYAYARASWWSFLGFFKKLFLLFFWVSQKNKCRYLAHLEWANFVKEDIAKDKGQLVDDKIDREINWGAIINREFLFPIETFGSLIARKFTLSQKQKHVVAFCVLEYIAASSLYSIPIKPDNTEVILRAISDLESLTTKAKDKKFNTYIAIAVINMRLFLQSLTTQNLPDRQLLNFFPEEIMQSNGAKRSWQQGRAFHKKHIENFASETKSEDPQRLENEQQSCSYVAYLAGYLGMEEKELYDPTLGEIRISPRAVRSAWRIKTVLPFHPDKLHEATAQSIDIHKGIFASAHKCYTYLTEEIEASAPKDGDLVKPLSREIYEHGPRQVYRDGKRAYVTSLQLSQSVKGLEEKDAKIKQAEDDKAAAEKTAEQERKAKVAAEKTADDERKAKEAAQAEVLQLKALLAAKEKKPQQKQKTRKSKFRPTFYQPESMSPPSAEMIPKAEDFIDLEQEAKVAPLALSSQH